MKLEDYKKEIEALDKRILDTAMTPASNWDFKGNIFPDEGLTPEERRHEAIVSLHNLRKKLLANAGDIALFGQPDNLGIG